MRMRSEPSKDTHLEHWWQAGLGEMVVRGKGFVCLRRVKPPHAWPQTNSSHEGAKEALHLCNYEEQKDKVGQKENYYDIFFCGGCGAPEPDLKHRIMFTSCQLFGLANATFQPFCPHL